MDASERTSLIPFGLCVFVLAGDLPLSLAYFGHYPTGPVSFVIGLIPLILAVLMYRHSYLARLLTVAYCLLVTVMLCWGLLANLNAPSSGTQMANNFVLGPGYGKPPYLHWPYCICIAFLLWLAWLFTLSPSARAWFPQSQPSAD